MTTNILKLIAADPNINPAFAKAITPAENVAETADKYRLKQATAHELDAAIDQWRESKPLRFADVLQCGYFRIASQPHGMDVVYRRLDTYRVRVVAPEGWFGHGNVFHISLTDDREVTIAEPSSFPPAFPKGHVFPPYKFSNEPWPDAE